MGVYLKNLNCRWPIQPGRFGRFIPYVVANPVYNDWVNQKVEIFNSLVGRKVFVPRINEAKYISIVISVHCSSNLGCEQIANQKLSSKHDQTTLFHEMGHCIGLGHENFHSGWPRLNDISEFHRYLHNQNKDKYQDYRQFDRYSIMLYPDDAYSLNPIIYRKNNTLSQSDIQLIHILMN